MFCLLPKQKCWDFLYNALSCNFKQIVLTQSWNSTLSGHSKYVKPYIQGYLSRYSYSTSMTFLQRTLPTIGSQSTFSRVRSSCYDHNAAKSAYKQPTVRNARRKYGKKQQRLKGKISLRMQGMKEDVWTIPNLLTLSRMVSAPVLGYLVIHGSYHAAVALFTVAGITDVLDGYIARRYKSQMSILGTALDPLADKLLIAVLTISLTIAQLLPVWLTVLVLSRDIALVGASAYTRYNVLPPPKSLAQFCDVTLPTAKIYPSNISKLNTLLQLSTVGFTLAAPVFGYIDHPYLHALWYLTAATTLASGVGYLRQAKKSFSIIKQSQR